MIPTATEAFNAIYHMLDFAWEQYAMSREASLEIYAGDGARYIPVPPTRVLNTSGNRIEVAYVLSTEDGEEIEGSEVTVSVTVALSTPQQQEA